jgi:competence protein ComEA
MFRLIKACLLSMAFASFSGTALAGPVNVNTADAETLERELSGIGPALAAAIVRDREENGPYSSPEDLTRVSGIGPSVLERNAEDIRVEDEQTESE